MAYKVIFTAPDGSTSPNGRIVEECILDSVPNIGDDVMITHYDLEGEPSGKVDTYPVLGRRWAYDKYDRVTGHMLDSQMHLVTVHISLGLPMAKGL